jgi:hypothetical protein
MIQKLENLMLSIVEFSKEWKIKDRVLQQNLTIGEIFSLITLMMRKLMNLLIRQVLLKK